MTEVVIRPYRTTDRDAIYDVCLRTADAGGDATSIYRDPDLVGDLFAGPYAHLAPDFAFVLDDGERAVGYVLGVPDTARYAEAVRDVWLPMVTPRYPKPAGPPRDRDEEMIEALYHPERMVHPDLADYPAHLHIDILPTHQRAGWGRKLMLTELAALHDAGCPRLHLGMLSTNTAARVFYDRLGFHELKVSDPGPITYLGRATDTTDLTG